MKNLEMPTINRSTPPASLKTGMDVESVRTLVDSLSATQKLRLGNLILRNLRLILGGVDKR